MYINVRLISRDILYRTRVYVLRPALRAGSSVVGPDGRAGTMQPRLILASGQAGSQSRGHLGGQPGAHGCEGGMQATPNHPSRRATERGAGHGEKRRGRATYACEARVTSRARRDRARPRGKEEARQGEYVAKETSSQTVKKPSTNMFGRLETRWRAH